MSVIGEAFVLVSPEASGFAKKAQAQLAGAGLGNIGLVAGAAIATGVIVGLNKIGSEFGKVRRIIRQETGAAEQDVEKLFGSVRAAVEQVPVGLEKAGQAVTLLFKRGVPLGPQLDKLAKQELFLAKITGSEVGPTVEKTTSLFAKFNIPLREQSKALDVLFKAQQRSGKSFDELLDPLQSGGAALQAFGFDLAKSAALITQLQIAGVNVQPALAGMRKAFGQIVKEGGDPKKVLADLIEEFRKAPNSAKAAGDALKLFGGRAGPELVSALRAGKFEFGDLLRILTDGKKGILETGEATLTLGDRIALLRARFEETLVPLGLAVRKAFVDAFIAVAEPLEKIGTAIGHTVQAVAPLALVLAPVGLALKAVVPAMTAFAAGLDGIASVLALLHNPAIAAGAGLAFLALEGLAIVQSLAAAQRAISALTLTLLKNPYFLVAAGIVAIGAAILSLRGHTDGAIKLSEQLGNALFDAESATTIFAAGIDNARQGVEEFITTAIKAGNADRLRAFLNATGTSVSEFTDKLTGSRTGFEQFARASQQALKAAGLSKLQIIALTETAVDNREAFELQAKVQTENAIATGVLTRAQKNAIVAQNRYKDGSVNIVAVLDAVNKKLRDSQQVQNEAVLSTQGVKDAQEELSQALAAGEISEKDAEASLGGLGIVGEEVAKQLERVKLRAQDITTQNDALALSTLKTSSAYGELSRKLATGEVTAAGATLALEDMGLTAAGAQAAFGELDSAIKSFVDGAISQVPDVGSAIDTFAQGVQSAQSSLESSAQKASEVQDQVRKALEAGGSGAVTALDQINNKIASDQADIASGSAHTTAVLEADLARRSEIIRSSGAAPKELRKAVQEANDGIIADSKRLLVEADPNKFTQTLLENAKKIREFNANLATLVDEGFGVLAGELAKKGPEAAAGLAESLANAPAKAAIASKAAELGKTTTDNYKKFLEENFPELTGTGAKQGAVIGKAIADGITTQLLHNFPLLRELGITTGDEVLGGTEQSIGKRDPTAPLRAAIRAQGGRWKPEGEQIGGEVGSGITAKFKTIDPTSTLAATLRRHREDVRTAGGLLGDAAGEGIAAGILSQRTKVGDAVISVTKYGVKVARSQWSVSSPSKVFAEIGSQAGKGLAQGISGSVTTVGAAASLLASSVTASVDNAITNIATFAPQIHPEITPVVSDIVLPVLPPIPARLAEIATPVIDPVMLDTRLGPLPQPEFDPVVVPVDLPVLDPLKVRTEVEPFKIPALPLLHAQVAPLDLPPFPSVRLSAQLAPLSLPTFDPLQVRVAPIDLPDLAPLTVKTIVEPLHLPTLDPVHVDVQPLDIPALAPLTAQVNVAPLELPKLDPLQATVAPIEMPKLAALNVQTIVEPFDLPAIEPVHVSVRPLDIPALAPLEAHVNVAPFEVPALAPLQASLAPIALPRLDPLPLSVQLAPFDVPVLDPLPATVAPITLPKFDPLPLTAQLAPFDVPALKPLHAELAPLAAPVVPTTVLDATFGRIDPPTLAPVTPVLAAVPATAADRAFAGVATSGERAGLVAARGLAAGISAFTPSVDTARFAATGQQAASVFSSSVVQELTAGAAPVAAAFQAVATPEVPDLEQEGRSVGTRLSTSVLSGAQDTGKHVASSISTSLHSALTGLQGIDLSGKSALGFLDKLRVAFTFITDAPSAAKWVSFASSLTDTFHDTAEKITVDATELQKVLDALTVQRNASATRLSNDLLRELQDQGLLVTKLAKVQPPSAQTIREQFQSVQVARPEDRENAQTPAAVTPRGVFDGATVQFPDRTDPLHLAAAIAWELNP